MLLKHKEKAPDYEVNTPPEQSNALGEKKAVMQTNVMASVLCVNSVPFSDLILKMNSSEIFPYVEDMLKYIGPAVSDNYGRFAQISDNGFTAVFEEDCKSALMSAVTMCQLISKNKNPHFNFKSFSVGISYGLVCTSPVGYKDYNVPLTISECTGLAGYLQEIAPKYNAHIIVTESVVKKTPEFFTKFNSRCLGSIILTKSGQSELLYDVYDGDTIEVKNSKRRSKAFFETGVKLFQENKYEQARSYFIELLKSDRNDSAAKEYLLLCDSCSFGEYMGTGRKNIELW